MKIQDKSRTGLVRWLFVGFVFTGVGTTLLGSVLPTLTTTWHMNDDRAGVLFAAQFSGSALGALLVRADFFCSVLRGYLLLIASAISIAFFPHFAAGLLFFSFGLGLGLTMTATSMLIATLYIGKRGGVLSLLNAFWAIGAAMCPAIASVWVTRWRASYLFLALAASVAVLLVMVAKHRKVCPAANLNSPTVEVGRNALRLVLIFAALGSLYVGVESSISGWMMSYVHRLPVANQMSAPLATSVFWIALLCGRMIAPAALMRFSETQLLNSCLTLGLISTVFLVVSHSSILIILVVASAGLALGPIFPLCLAKALAALNDSPKAKWVFSISGIGGAALPWMTGKISAQQGSLRAGLLVPVFALAAMMILIQLEPGFADRER